MRSSTMQFINIIEVRSGLFGESLTLIKLLKPLNLKIGAFGSQAPANLLT